MPIKTPREFYQALDQAAALMEARQYDQALIRFNLVINDYRVNGKRKETELYEEAINYLEAKVEPDTISQGYVLLLARFYVYLAVADMATKEEYLQKAEKLYLKVLKEDADHPEALRGVGDINVQKGLYFAAITVYYNRAIASSSRFARAYTNRGLCYYALKEYEKALADYTLALSLDPNSAIAYTNRGLCYYELKEYEKALADCTQALSLDPNEAISYNNRGLCYYELKEYEKALADYSRSIDLDEGYNNAYRNRGSLYYRLEKYDQAIEDYNKAIELGWDWLIYDRDQAILARDGKKTELYQCVKDIKKVLRFEGEEVVHYTSVDTLAKLSFQSTEQNPPRFRLSNVVHLNDPMEGHTFFDFLKAGKGEEEIKFYERMEQEMIGLHTPIYIGSFVVDPDDMVLWRTYGKNKDHEAAGCSITFGKHFLQEKDDQPQRQDRPEEQLNEIYRVSYYKLEQGQNTFFLDTESKANEELGQLFEQLKEKLGELIKPENDWEAFFRSEEFFNLGSLLSQVLYLLKPYYFNHEKERRLISTRLPGNKQLKIDAEARPPRVYLELEQPPAIKKITLGPRVERVDEWISTLKWYFEKRGEKEVEVEKSRQRFK